MTTANIITAILSLLIGGAVGYFIRKLNSISKKEFEKYKEEKLHDYIQKEIEKCKKKLHNYIKCEVKRIRSEIFAINEIKDNPDSDYLEKLRVLIIGDSKLNKNEIIEIFKESFNKHLDVEIPKKCFEIPALNYNDITKIDIPKKLKLNRYDYIIFGPRPHSTKNKEMTQSIDNLKKELNLKAVILGDIKNKPLNKSHFEKMALKIVKNWNNN